MLFNRSIAGFSSAVLLAVYFLPTACQAEVIEATNVLAESGPGYIGLQAAYGIEHGESAPCHQSTGCYAYALFAYDGHSIVYADSTPDLSDHGDWYVVDRGDTFSESTADTFPAVYVNYSGMSPVPVEVGLEDFYLGIRTSGDRRTAYGWVHLRPSNGVLSMVQNVMSYNSRGIIVGTTTVVPEPPSIAAVFGAAFLTLVSCRRAARRRLQT